MRTRTLPHDTPDDIDLILRHVSRRFPQDLARALIRTGEPIGPATWAETQVTGRQRRLDRALRVKVGRRSRFFHMEWTLRLTKAIPFRVFEYNSLTVLAAVDEARVNKKDGRPAPKPWRVDSVVVVLTGRRNPLPEHGVYRTSSSGERFSGVRFRIEPVYQRTVAELLALGSVFWLIFTPLAVDADETKLARVLKTLRAQTTERDFAELGAAMAALAQVNRRDQSVADVIKSLLPREIVMQNWIYKEGVKHGVKKGVKKGVKQGVAQGRLEPLAHQFERRLGRSLSADEQARLAERLDKEGPEKVGDVVLDLSADALCAWLAPARETNGHGT
jgi:hypothetical protein